MSQNLWNAPHINGERFSATVSVPPSKSLTNRYLILQALAQNDATINNVLVARDTNLMRNAINKIKEFKKLLENDQYLDPKNQILEIDTGLAGTVMRFVPIFALAYLAGEACAGAKIRFVGDKQMYSRPIGPILDVFEQLNVKVCRENGEFPPFSFIITSQINISKVKIDASASSQFVSALMLSAPYFPKGLEISVEEAPSQTHIDMTIECLKKCAVAVQEVKLVTSNTITNAKFQNKLTVSRSWIIPHHNIIMPNISIEPDLSNAGPFLCAPLANQKGGEVQIPYWPNETTQPGKMFPEILKDMGADVSYNKSAKILKVSFDKKDIKGVNLDLSDAGEITPTVVALCALSKDESIITGVGHLRGHETDRLQALITELSKIGRNAHIVNDDSIVIEAIDSIDDLKPAIIESYNDHRMATFGAILGLRIKGIQITNISTVSKTMPLFTDLWQRMIGLDG